jgi:Flp pilus assembly protein TadD
MANRRERRATRSKSREAGHTGELQRAAQLLDGGALAEAGAMLRRIVQDDPRNAPAHALLGLAALRRNELDEAVRLTSRAIELDPRQASFHCTLAGLYRMRGEPKRVEESFRRALALDGNQFIALNNLGMVLAEDRRFGEAVPLLLRAVTLKPDYAEAHNNLASALESLGDLPQALRHAREATRLLPGYAEAHNTLGVILKAMGQPVEARERYRRAQRLKPDYADAHFNEAIIALLLGELREGWAKWEWRWRTVLKGHPPVPGERWVGQPLQGKSIFLHWEQGLGDTIQFLRYVPMLARLDAAITVEVQQPLKSLAEGSFSGIARIIAPGETPPPTDYQIPLMSLPGAFETALETIPAEIPYLTVAGDRARHWQARLGARGKLKVGLAWAGNPDHRNDHARSLPFERLKPLFDVADVGFFSLQVGPRRADLDQVGPGIIEDLASELVDFTETAAAVTNLDLLIACDTAVAHLCGALGLPIWLCLCFASEWRWLRERVDSPWYPTMRIFRQSAPGDWAGVIAAVGEALRWLARSRDQ